MADGGLRDSKPSYICDALLKRSDPKQALAILENGDSEMDNLLDVYSKCWSALNLKGNESIDTGLISVSKQTMENVKMRRKNNPEQLTNRVQVMQSKVEKLKEDLDNGSNLMKNKRSVQQQLMSKIQQFDHKTAEYRKDSKLLEEMLTDSGFNVGLTKESLDSLEAENKSLQDRLNVCREKMNDFRSVEPNETAIRSKIAEMKRQIADLDNYFRRQS